MRKEYDDIGEQWLRKNDPLYGDRKKSKYMTSDMADWAYRHELPSGREFKSIVKSINKKSYRDMRDWIDLGDGNYKRVRHEESLNDE